MRVKMRVLHRYLGFFLTGIMSVYAVTGFVLIFRKTNTFKVERTYEKTLKPGLSLHKVGKQIRIGKLKLVEDRKDQIVFRRGTYDKTTGFVRYRVMKLPSFLRKLTKLHKSTTRDPLYLLNLFFSVALLFFVVSSFFMFPVGAKIFRRGMFFVVAGVMLTVFVVYF